MQTKHYWQLEIKPKSGLLDLKLREFWQYRDLLLLFVRRELVPTYKQTVLGPLWFVLQPLLTTLVYSIVFGMVARIPTDGAPQLLFYLPGIVLWNFFSTSFLKSSSTLVANTHIFGKVYFPRLVIPVSGLLASMVNFGIQFCLFLTIFAGYYFTGSKVSPSAWIFAFPALILILSTYSLGLGLIVSSLTIRYRDLTHFLSFGVQLLMYATPIIYPASIIPANYKWVSYANPLSPVFEAFRFSFLGTGVFNVPHLLVSFVFGLVVLFLGIVLFNQAQRTSIDTV